MDDVVQIEIRITPNWCTMQLSTSAHSCLPPKKYDKKEEIKGKEGEEKSKNNIISPKDQPWEDISTGKQHSPPE